MGLVQVLVRWRALLLAVLNLLSLLPNGPSVSPVSILPTSSFHNGLKFWKTVWAFKF